MSSLFSILTGLLSLVCGVLALNFSLELPGAVHWYPWPDGRLSRVWIGSMFAAYTLPLGWLALVGERRAAGPGYLALALTGFGLGWHFNEEMVRQQLPGLSAYAMGALSLGIGSSGMALWASLSPESGDKRLSPSWLRWFVFAPVVFVVGVAALLLVLRHPRIFPWPLKPETSVMFGIIFFASAVYHSFTVIRSEWRHAKGQLLGFVGYNCVLIGPYFGHFWTVKPLHRLSLIGFFIIILATTLVAVFVLARRRADKQ